MSDRHTRLNVEIAFYLHAAFALCVRLRGDRNQSMVIRRSILKYIKETIELPNISEEDKTYLKFLLSRYNAPYTDE